MAQRLLLFFLPPLIFGIGILVWTFLRHRASNGETTELEDKSPLRLWSAIQLGLALQVVLMAITFVRQTWGSTGIIPSAAILGLTDVDALTFSMAKLGTSADMADLAARAIVVGILANTALKTAMVLIVGAGSYRWRAALGLIGLGAAGALGLWLGIERVW